MLVTVTVGRALRSLMWGECQLQLRAGSLVSLICLLSGVHWYNLSDQQGGEVSMTQLQHCLVQMQIDRRGRDVMWRGKKVFLGEKVFSISSHSFCAFLFKNDFSLLNLTLYLFRQKVFSSFIKVSLMLHLFLYVFFMYL